MKETAAKSAKRTAKILIGLFLLGCAYALMVNMVVVWSTKSAVVCGGEAGSFNAQAILVLGCEVYADGSLSPMLEERCETALELYEAGAAKTIIVSGDHQNDTYNEVDPMRTYLFSRGVAFEDIVCDPYGLCTYDSVFRAKEVFGFERLVIVTQRFHLYRALYIADAMGMECVGVDAMKVRYAGQFLRDVREFLARNKDFLLCLCKPQATVMPKDI